MTHRMVILQFVIIFTTCLTSRHLVYIKLGTVRMIVLSNANNSIDIFMRGGIYDYRLLRIIEWVILLFQCEVFTHVYNINDTILVLYNITVLVLCYISIFWEEMFLSCYERE